MFNNETPNVHPEIRGFNLKISPTGIEYVKYSVDDINAFLTKYVPDKKLKHEVIEDIWERVRNQKPVRFQQLKFNFDIII